MDGVNNGSLSLQVCQCQFGSTSHCSDIIIIICVSLNHGVKLRLQPPPDLKGLVWRQADVVTAVSNFGDFMLRFSFSQILRSFRGRTRPVGLRRASAQRMLFPGVKEEFLSSQIYWFVWILQSGSMLFLVSSSSDTFLQVQLDPDSTESGATSAAAASISEINNLHQGRFWREERWRRTSNTIFPFKGELRCF